MLVVIVVLIFENDDVREFWKIVPVPFPSEPATFDVTHIFPVLVFGQVTDVLFKTRVQIDLLWLRVRREPSCDPELFPSQRKISLAAKHR